MLVSAGILLLHQSTTNYADFNYLFMNGNTISFYVIVWADNADALSMQYSGTGALKTDFTRSGKRSTKGALQDLSNSINRYVRNNFMDGYRQDCHDLFLGVYDIKPFSPFQQKQPFIYWVSFQGKS